jgi:hypothetical protein
MNCIRGKDYQPEYRTNAKSVLCVRIEISVNISKLDIVTGTSFNVEETAVCEI